MATGIQSRIAALLLGMGLFTPAFGAVTLPTWFGDPNTTSQVFLFNTASTTPTPNTSANPYGTTSATVDVGFFGNGWENPADLPISNPGFNGDGAWDIGAGNDGSITFQVPVAPSAPLPGQSYRLDIMIYVIAYKDLQELPEASVLGLAPGDLVLTASNVLSTRPPAGTWRELTWQAVKNGHDSGSLTVALTPPTGDVSVIDRVEIYTRYEAIPEPSVALLAVASALALGSRRRRRFEG
jgi:hypothetical protein